MNPKLLNGMLELLMLEVISNGPSYGYQIVQTVLSRSGGRFEMKEGSLYPALHRLERQKFLRSYWREFEGRRRKYYELTPPGRKALAAQRDEWKTLAQGVGGILGLDRLALGK